MSKTLPLLLIIMGSLIGLAQEKVTEPPDISRPPELAWKYSLDDPIFSSPVIADQTVYFGCLDSVFYALDLGTGKLRWKFKSGGEIRSTCAIYDHLIIFTSGDGKVHCLNSTGQLVWSFSAIFDKKYDFADYFQSSPVIDEGIVFFGSGDGAIYAVNAHDGSLIWKYMTGCVVHARPVISDGLLYVGSFDGYVYALLSANGELIWRFKSVGHRYFPLGEVQGNPAIAGDLVLVGARDYNVYAIDAANGYCHWNRAFMNGWVLSNTIHDSVLYMAGADERMLAAVDPFSGKTLWKRDMEFLQFGNPVFSKNMIYTGTTIGKVHGIDKETGDVLWSFATDGYRQNRLKYFNDDDSYRGDIYSIITSNEQFLEMEMELGGIFSSLAIIPGYLVFTSTEGSVYCLRSAD